VSVQRFRSIEEMSAAPVPERASLAARIDALWRRSAALTPAWPRPQGVFRFRSVEEMEQQRSAWETERARQGHPRADGSRKAPEGV
jgi:hypothetical protein